MIEEGKVNLKSGTGEDQKVTGKYGPDIVGKAIEQYHRADLIKSMVVAISTLVEETSRLKGEQLIGAQRLMSCLLDALLREIGIASTLTKLHDLDEARNKIIEVAGRVQMQEYAEANKCIGEALSFITVCAKRAAEVLKEEGLW